MKSLSCFFFLFSRAKARCVCVFAPTLSDWLNDCRIIYAYYTSTGKIKATARHSNNFFLSFSSHYVLSHFFRAHTRLPLKYFNSSGVFPLLLYVPALRLPLYYKTNMLRYTSCWILLLLFALISAFSTTVNRIMCALNICSIFCSFALSKSHSTLVQKNAHTRFHKIGRRIDFYLIINWFRFIHNLFVIRLPLYVVRPSSRNEKNSLLSGNS